MSEPEWKAVLGSLAASARAAGLDLAHPFAIGWYNAAVSIDEQLEDFGSAGSLGVLLGNTRALWPVFTRALADDPRLASSPHPLDSYVEGVLHALTSELLPRASRGYFAHSTRPRAVPMQRLAELAGLAAVSPSQLAIHPLHGPWFALRAVLIIDTIGPSQAPALERPCVGCSRPCLPPFEHALKVSGSPLTARAIAEHQDAWIAARDACPVGRGSRYDEAQLRYHYAPSRSLLQGS